MGPPSAPTTARAPAAPSASTAAWAPAAASTLAHPWATDPSDPTRSNDPMASSGPTRSGLMASGDPIRSGFRKGSDNPTGDAIGFGKPLRPSLGNLSIARQIRSAERRTALSQNQLRVGSRNLPTRHTGSVARRRRFATVPLVPRAWSSVWVQDLRPQQEGGRPPTRSQERATLALTPLPWPSPLCRSMGIGGPVRCGDHTAAGIPMGGSIGPSSTIGVRRYDPLAAPPHLRAAAPPRFLTSTPRRRKAAELLRLRHSARPRRRSAEPQSSRAAELQNPRAPEPQRRRVAEPPHLEAAAPPRLRAAPATTSAPAILSAPAAPSPHPLR